MKVDQMKQNFKVYPAQCIYFTPNDFNRVIPSIQLNRHLAYHQISITLKVSLKPESLQMAWTVEHKFREISNCFRESNEVDRLTCLKDKKQFNIVQTKALSITQG